MIFISHKLEEVMAISDRITVLRRGKVVGTVNCAETSEVDLARMMVGREVVLKVSSEHRKYAERALVASLEGISARKDFGTLGLDNVDLNLYSGEIVGVAGVDGNGQTELAEVIAGLRPPITGVLRIGEQEYRNSDSRQRIDQGVYYVPAERKQRGAVMDLPIYVNAILKNHCTVPFSHRGVLNHGVVQAFAEEQVREYDVRCSSIYDLAATLSGGNLQKLILAREISGRPKILIAEQPTRGLDVGAIEYVHQLLLRERNEGCAVLLISADLDEVLALSDRIIVMYEGKIVYECESENASREEIGLAMGGAMCANSPQGS